MEAEDFEALRRVVTLVGAREESREGRVLVVSGVAPSTIARAAMREKVVLVRLTPMDRGVEDLFRSVVAPAEKVK